MNRQNFNIPGGFPIETNTLDEMQKAYSLLNALGEIAGDKAILQGCVDDGENVGKGVVYVGGELFAFRGGPKQATVVIQQDAVEKTFENGQQHPVLYKRYVTFGSGPEALNWSEFKRYRLVEEVGELKADVDGKFTDVNSQLTKTNDKLTGLNTALTEVDAELAGKAPLVHDHDDRYYTQDQTDGFFEGESDGKKQVNWDRVTEKPTAYPPAAHNHDDRYYTQDQTDGFFEGESYGKKQVNWNRVTGKPGSYTPSYHTHDDRYYRKSEIRDYGSLTDITYASIGSEGGYSLDTSFYSSDRVCCYARILHWGNHYHEIKVLQLGFAKIQIT